MILFKYISIKFKEEQVGISHYELTCLLLLLQDNDTPLHIASSDGHDVVVDMLLKAGANPSAVGSVCIWHERDKIMIMGLISYVRFL